MASPPARRSPADERRPKVAPHAGRKLFLGYAALGVLVAAAGVFGMTSSWSSSIVLTSALELFTGLCFLAIGVLGIASGAAAQAVNMSLNLIGQGRLREADALLDTVSRSRMGSVRRVAHVQRAMIAIRRGKIAEATAATDAAIAVPLGWMGRMHAAMQKTNAHSIRALLRVSSSDEAGAAADIAEVRKDANALPQSRARAALAEALLLEKAGDRASLGRLLQRERALLLETTEPRERAIVRGLQRLVKTPASSVYRVQAPQQTREAEEEELSVSEWAQAIAPRVAPFVRAQARPVSAPRGEARAAEPTAEARAAVKADRSRAEQDASRSTRPDRLRRIALTVVPIAALMVAFGYFVSGIVDAAHDHRGEEALAGPLTAVGAVAVAGICMAIANVVLRIRGARRESRELTRVSAQVISGDREAAARALDKLAKSSSAMIAAQAELMRAGLAQRRGHFAEVVARCDAALGRLSRYAVRLLASDLLLPEVIATRSAALAALGRAEEAAAELALLPPAYPFLARARFRTELYALAHEGDLEGAAEVAAQAPPDLPIGPRDELLRDLVRAAVAPSAAGSGELERLRAELRENPEERAWIEVVAPGLLSKFERATTSDDADDADDADDRRAETEAAAEAEALASAEAASHGARRVS